MLNLIRNEYAKIFLKKSTYIILGLCLLVSVGISALIQYSYEDWDEYYYNETSFSEELSHMGKTTDVYELVYMKMCQTFQEMGYEYYSEISDWLIENVRDAAYSHYIYVALSESDNIEYYESEYGLSLDGIDVEYEKKIGEEKIALLKSGDYKGYSQKCIEYMDYQKSQGIEYESYMYETYRYIIENNINPEENQGKMQALSIYADAKAGYDELLAQKEAGENVSQYSIEQQKKIYTIYQYIMDNDIDNYLTEELDLDWKPDTNKFITALTSNTMVASMAGIFVMIIAAGIIANEFSNGTIKFLLINPVKRAKIFWSKYITCISLLVSTLAAFYVVYFLFCMIMCGTDGINGVYLSYDSGAVVEQSIIVYSLKQYALCGVSLLTSITLAFTISSLLKNNAIAIAISVVVELLGATITAFLYAFGHDWARYLVFANTDLASISTGQALFPGQTLQFSLTVIAVYMVIFLLTAYDGFKKKEV